MGIVLLLAVPFRIVIGWLYNRTGASVLLVALFHASFNVGTSSVLFAALIPGRDAVSVTAAVLVLSAVGVVVLTRGRLAQPRQNPPPALPAGGP
jgi:membrane protease YdiL (CAAX protease family)